MSKEAEQIAKGERNTSTLEVCFIALVGIVVLSAFVSALTYDFVSARAPLFIMVPLLVLIALQVRRAVRGVRREVLLADLSRTVRGQSGNLNAVVGFAAWMVALLGLIFVAGHYIGIAAFMFVSLRMFSRETMPMSVSVTAVVTAVIYFLFELGFNIELHRGMLFRLLSG